MSEQTIISISNQSPRRVFYHSLVKWNMVDEIVFLTDPPEHPQVRELIMDILDQVVMDTVLHHLAEAEHEEFLELCHRDYQSEEILAWLADRIDAVEDQLQTTIQTAKQDIRALLIMP